MKERPRVTSEMDKVIIELFLSKVRFVYFGLNRQILLEGWE